MPEILDRCVMGQMERGVSQSSAFAICTAALQRAGKLPRGRGKSAFPGWAKRVALPEPVYSGMENSWPTLTSPDQSLLKSLRKVQLTDREGILGSAFLHSKVIALNPEMLEKAGGQPLWYGAVAIHEAQHALYGFGEHEATRAEQRFLGKCFGESKMDFDRPGMFLSCRASTVAQAQRMKDVHVRHRRNDYQFLVSCGYTPRVARKIIEGGKRAYKARLAAAMPIRLIAAKDAKDYFELDDTYLHAVVDKEFAASLDEFVVEKVFPGFDIYAGKSGMKEPERFGGFRSVMEGYIRQAVGRGVGVSERGPLGIVPVLRRHNWDIDALPDEWQQKRADALAELTESLKTEGLYNDEGDPTEPHLLCILNGWTPVPHLVFSDVTTSISG